MTNEQMLARITTDNDQEQAACDQWMRETPASERLKVWLCIQQDYTDPYMEIMSRFAQLAFAQSIERTRA